MQKKTSKMYVHSPQKKKTLNYHASSNLTIECIPKRTKSRTHTDICTAMFIGALVTTQNMETTQVAGRYLGVVIFLETESRMEVKYGAVGRAAQKVNLE